MRTAEEIAELEWEMFQKVQNQGGRADCQDDRETFFIMRTSQLIPWTAELRESYCRDLLEARERGRNLLTLKYAYMMERTAPEEFASIRHLLPQTEENVRRLADEIVEAQLAQFRQLAGKYPRFMGKARGDGQAFDRAGETSFETYLWGELRTYSEKTLILYQEFLKTERGGRLVEAVMEATARQYGYASLPDAEKACGCLSEETAG